MQGDAGRRPGGFAADTGCARVFRLRRNGLRPPVPRTWFQPTLQATGPQTENPHITDVRKIKETHFYGRNYRRPI